MSLGAKQEIFSRLLPLLIIKAHDLGFEVRLKELHRPRETAELYAKQGRGVANSLHCDGLAIDLVLFRHGVPLWASEAYRELGEYWECLDPVLCSWGGRFDDGGHFSIMDGGRR